uniref:ATP-dependent RNA helicase n=1 Tax=Neogobius melanostomus TaxID=47308 RepID=A0A8C6WIX3_9GOBI
MKPHGKRPIKPAKRSIHLKGKWKSVELDPGLFSDEGMEGLVCFEELTSYRLVDTEKAAARAAKEQDREHKKKAPKRKATEEKGDAEATGEATETPKKKAKKKKMKKSTEGEEKAADEAAQPERNEETKSEAVEDSVGSSQQDLLSKPTNKNNKKKAKKMKKEHVNESTSTEEQPVHGPPSQDQPVELSEKAPKSKPAKPPKMQIKNWTSAALSGCEDTNADMRAWKDLYVPAPVLKALSSLGFSSPTPIQALALPSAIRDRMDILGAAETGSGKTLAFAIPMIHNILEWKEHPDQTVKSDTTKIESLYLPDKPTEADKEAENEAEDDDPESAGAVVGDSDGDPDDNDDDEGGADDIKLGCVQVGAKAPFDPAPLEETPSVGSQNQPLLGLVLTPTRELAVQVKHHIDAVAKFTNIKTAIVVGGMSQHKQRRLLKRRPEIIVATPGRLWDLVKEKDPHLQNLRQLRCLVIDEADRMVERGHFAELESILEALHTVHFNPKRQMFIFSATLTLAYTLPTRLLQKKKKRVDKRSKLEILMEKVGIRAKPKVIDLTRKEATVESLTETRIHCQKDDKDYFLYYFLLQHPGRTMVFANSIDCIKRLKSILTILDCTAFSLHANMQQKQRLRSLERFADRESVVLLTTDVAARGLDIPDVQQVIHYQIPRTSETYVHRSGRTARATKEGLCLLLIGPDDVLNFKKIFKTLGKDEDLPMFPIETECMEAIKERVDLARNIESIEYHNCKEKKHNSWFRQAAEALEVDLDEDLLLGKSKDEHADVHQQRMVKGMKAHLKHLISQPVFKKTMKTKYPTQMGKLSFKQTALAGTQSALSKVLMQQTTRPGCPHGHTPLP